MGVKEEGKDVKREVIFIFGEKRDITDRRVHAQLTIVRRGIHTRVLLSLHLLGSNRTR